MVYNTKEQAFNHAYEEIKAKLMALREKYPNCDFIAEHHITEYGYTLSEREKLFGYQIIQIAYSWETNFKYNYKEYIEVPVLEKVTLEEVKDGEYEATPEYKNVVTDSYVMREETGTKKHTEYVAVVYKFVEGGTEKEVLDTEEEIWQNEEGRAFCQRRGMSTPEVYHGKNKSKDLFKFIGYIILCVVTLALLSSQFYTNEVEKAIVLTLLGIVGSFITYLLYSIEEQECIVSAVIVSGLSLFFIIYLLRKSTNDLFIANSLYYYVISIIISVIMLIVYTVRIISLDKIEFFHVEFPIVIVSSLVGVVNWGRELIANSAEYNEEIVQILLNIKQRLGEYGNVLNILFYIAFACSAVLLLVKIIKRIKGMGGYFKLENARAKAEINGNYSEKELHEKYIKIMSYIKS